MKPSTLWAALALTFLGCGCGGGGGPRLRIVVVTLDTLRADALEAMPLTRARAERGLAFERSFAASSTTQPTHATLLTGLHPWQHGVVRNGLVLDESFETLPERLRAAGFGTGAVVASFPLHGRFGYAQGFEHYDDRFSKKLVDVWEGHATDSFYSLAEDVDRRALELLERIDGSRQFLWFHYFDPHDPYGDTVGAPPMLPGTILSEVHGGGAEAGPLLERARQLYLADVRSLDRALEALLARLEADSERWETHVLVVADHGESFGEQGSVGHGRRLSEEQVLVPCFLISPRVAAGTRGDAVGTIDLAATLLALAGLDPASTGGRDLLQPEPSRGRAFGMRRTFEGAEQGTVAEFLVDGTQRVLAPHEFFFADGDRVWRGSSEGVRLDDAPDEASGEEAERVRALFSTFEGELAGRSAGEVSDPETLEALKALGYTR